MNESVKANLIKKIRELRIKNNISQRVLSELLGLDSSYISKFERGTINISLEKIIDIANHFNVEVKEFFE